ncbi:MAG: hypothetical protein SF052_05720 [Bacteroidia bacterium]|nr:hypothetical protein [Bacteroidia bacterium]
MKARRQKPVTGILLTFFLFSSLSVFSQCDNLLKFSSANPEIRITGIMDTSPKDFPTGFVISSPQGVQVTLTAQSLVNPQTKDFIPPEYLVFSKNAFGIGKGKKEEILVAVSQLAKSGVYKGTIFIEAQDSECNWTIPVTVDIKDPNQVAVVEEDASLNLKMASPSWFNGILPPKINNQTISVRIENTGQSPMEMERFSLTLKGKETGESLTEADFTWKNEDKIIPPGGIGVAQFEVNNTKQLRPDEYTGRVRIHYKDYPDTSTVSMTVFSRIGVFGALIALVLGIIVGRLMKSVDQAGPQLELMDKYIPLRTKADRFSDEISRKHILGELDSVEAEINKVKDEEGKAAVLELLAPTEKKVSQIQQLERLHLRVGEQIKNKNISSSLSGDLGTSLQLVRDNILNGNDEEVQQGLARVQGIIASDSEASKSRSIGGVDIPGADQMIQVDIDRIGTTMGTSDTPGTPQAKTFWQKLESIWLRFISFFSGVNASARVRYAYFRPLVALATFIVVLLLGFQQIYIDGGDTFGSEGLYDYLKLFLWGVISDVFSRTLSGGDEKISTFMAGKV